MSHDINTTEMQPSRREVLIKGVATSIALAGFGSHAGIVLAGTPGVTHGETPGVTEGPYWVDGQLERSDVRVDTSTGTTYTGIPIHLGITVSQLKDTTPYTVSPLVNARIDIWCANAQGVYSDEAVENTTGENYLRGYQMTNAHGIVNFLTIYPGWYSGRTPHIHARVRTYNSAGTVTYNYTTQFFFNETITSQIFTNTAYSRSTARDTTNATDSVFTGSSANASPAKEAGDYLLLKMANDGTYVIGAFHIVVDLSDTANADATNGGTGGGGMGVNAITPKKSTKATTSGKGRSRSK